MPRSERYYSQHIEPPYPGAFTYHGNDSYGNASVHNAPVQSPARPYAAAPSYTQYEGRTSHSQDRRASYGSTRGARPPPNRSYANHHSRPTSSHHQQQRMAEPKPYDRRYSEDRPPRSSSNRKKLWLCLFLLLLLLLIGLAVGLGVGLTKSKSKSFKYVPSTASVTNATAFTSGAATHRDPEDVNDGIGAGSDTYTYYSGDASQFPPSSKWVSFNSMWDSNYDTIANSCKYLGYKKDNTASINANIRAAIQDRAKASLVDHRFILAIILQESHGCVHIDATTSQSGVKNPGLMQSHSGHEFNAQHERMSILQMVQDGVQGTEHGQGLVNGLDYFGNVYSAARYYNSGYIPQSGNLSEKAGATACYVSDVANRLTGWVKAESKCVEN